MVGMTQNICRETRPESKSIKTPIHHAKANRRQIQNRISLMPFGLILKQILRESWSKLVRKVKAKVTCCISHFVTSETRRQKLEMFLCGTDTA